MGWGKRDQMGRAPVVDVDQFASREAGDVRCFPTLSRSSGVSFDSRFLSWSSVLSFFCYWSILPSFSPQKTQIVFVKG